MMSFYGLGVSWQRRKLAYGSFGSGEGRVGAHGGILNSTDAFGHFAIRRAVGAKRELPNRPARRWLRSVAGRSTRRELL